MDLVEEDQDLILVNAEPVIQVAVPPTTAIVPPTAGIATPPTRRGLREAGRLRAQLWAIQQREGRH